MTGKFIRRMSDGRWLGLNMGIQPKWVKDKRGAYFFMDTAALQPSDVLRQCRKYDCPPSDKYEIVGGDLSTTYGWQIRATSVRTSPRVDRLKMGKKAGTVAAPRLEFNPEYLERT